MCVESENDNVERWIYIELCESHLHISCYFNKQVINQSVTAANKIKICGICDWEWH
jgi:hypothetical protein